MRIKERSGRAAAAARIGRQRPRARHRPLEPEQLAAVAGRFGALGEPSRLRLLEVLREGEHSVGALMVATGFTQPNVSKHLRVLHQLGFVRRRKAGVSTYYRLADRDVLRLCDIMCRRLAAAAAAERALFGE